MMRVMPPDRKRAKRTFLPEAMMKRSISWLMLPCGFVCLAVLSQDTAAKDRDKEKNKPAARHHAPPPNNPTKLGNPGGGNPPAMHRNAPNNPAVSGNATPRKIEPPKHQP